MGKKPDFICIGAQKAGTSWLNWNLMFHPETNMPLEKEINYFNYYKNTGRIQWLFGSKGRRWRARAKLLITQGDWKNFFWLLRYINRSPKPEWYFSLFPKNSNRISGDMSPNYATLEEEDIQFIKRCLPNVKIIYLLRDPIDRMWSHYRMAKSGTKTPSLEEIRQFFLIPGVLEKSSYSQHIIRWKKIFEQNFRIWFLEEISSTPGKMFCEVCQFLDIAPLVSFPHEKITQKVHVSPALEIPESVYQWLKSCLKEEILRLDEILDNQFTKAWIQKHYPGELKKSI